MTAATPFPQTTLVILLGASKWPYAPEFQASKAFLNAAMDIREYFLNPSQFALPQENFLNLFNSDQSADDIDQEIGQFLDQRLSQMKELGLAAGDVVVYFVGHGGFAGGDAEYYLAIRRTRAANPTASGIRIVSLAHTLKEQARYLRRIVILDCCFAAAAFRAFQATPAQVAITQALDAFKVSGKGEGIPGRGTSLLCSSRHNRPSLLLLDGSSTMFSQALLEALTTGNPHQQGPLSLQDVASLAEDVLRARAATDAPRPEVHSPDQSEGDIAQLPFFPNPAARAASASMNVETSPAAERPLQPIHGQPSQVQSEPPLRQTQQSYVSNAEPGSVPFNAASVPNQSQQFTHPPATPGKPQVVPQGGGTASISSRQNNKAVAPHQRHHIYRVFILLGVLLLIGSIAGTFYFTYIRTQTSAGGGTANTIIPAQQTVAAMRAQALRPANPDPYSPYNGKLVLYDSLRDNMEGNRWKEFNEKMVGTGVVYAGQTNACKFTQSAYHVIIPSNFVEDTCLAEATDFSNFTYEIQMKFVSAAPVYSGGGLIFRANGGDYYYFELFESGRYDFACNGRGDFCEDLQKGKVGTGVTIPAFHKGLNQKNVVAVVAKGNVFDIYVNGQHVIGPVNDISYTHGMIGVLSHGGYDPITGATSTPTEVAYSNVRVWQL